MCYHQELYGGLQDKAAVVDSILIYAHAIYFGALGSRKIEGAAVSDSQVGDRAAKIC